jgi:hypothetical protein
MSINKLTKEKKNSSVKLEKILKRRKNKNKKILVSLFKIIKCNRLSIFKNKFNIVIKANNIFCTFTKIFRNRIIQSASSGMYKIKTTKKRIKYTYKKMLTVFINKINQRSKTYLKQKNNFFNMYNPLILNITAKKKLHKYIIKKFRKFGKRQNYTLTTIEAKKCFNGCRSSKKRRKKRLRNVIFG